MLEINPGSSGESRPAAVTFVFTHHSASRSVSGFGWRETRESLLLTEPQWSWRSRDKETQRNQVGRESLVTQRRDKTKWEDQKTSAAAPHDHHAPLSAVTLGCFLFPRSLCHKDNAFVSVHPHGKQTSTSCTVSRNEASEGFASALGKLHGADKAY